MADMTEVSDELLTVLAVTDCLKVSKWTLANWRRCGFGPPYVRLKGNDIRYPATALMGWIEDRTVRSLDEERDQGREFPGSAVGGFGAQNE